MRRAWWALGIALALGALVACGPQEGPEVTVRLVSPIGEGSPATATVVYQVGDGEWRLAVPVEYGVYTFRLPPGEKRYGVAVNCISSFGLLATLGWANVYFLTVDEADEIKVACLNLSDLTFTSVEVKAHAAPGDTGYNRAWYYGVLGGSQKDFPNTAGLALEAKPDRDLLIVAYSDSTSKWQPQYIERIKFVRDLDASSPPVAAKDYELSTADTPTTAHVGAFTPPSWADGGSFFGVGFVSKQGIVVPHSSDDPDENPALGTGDETGGDYVKVPDTQPGDVYYAEASAWDASHTYYTSHVQVLEHDGPDLTFALPQTKFDPIVVEAALPTFQGLDYPDPALAAYAFSYNFPDFHEMVVVSKGWLGSDTRFTLPDLTSAPDFRGTKPLKGEHVVWRAMAVMTGDLGELLAGDPMPLPNPMPRTAGLWVKIASKAGEYDVP